MTLSYCPYVYGVELSEYTYIIKLLKHKFENDLPSLI